MVDNAAKQISKNQLPSSMPTGGAPVFFHRLSSAVIFLPSKKIKNKNL